MRSHRNGSENPKDVAVVYSIYPRQALTLPLKSDGATDRDAFVERYDPQVDSLANGGIHGGLDVGVVAGHTADACQWVLVAAKAEKSMNTAARTGAAPAQ